MNKKPSQYVVKDSGVRQEFSTGSKRDSREGKGRFDLIPSLPLRRLALHYEAGSKKYGDNNWQKGQDLARYVDSATRHLNCLIAGEPVEDHATAVIWNMFSYIWTLDQIENGLLPKSLDNRQQPEPQYHDKKPGQKKSQSRRTAGR